MFLSLGVLRSEGSADAAVCCTDTVDGVEPIAEANFDDALFESACVSCLLGPANRTSAGA